MAALFDCCAQAPRGESIKKSRNELALMWSGRRRNLERLRLTGRIGRIRERGPGWLVTSNQDRSESVVHA